MTALSVQPPFPILTDIDGQPLEDGYIWIGVANLAPITNPITVYWDAALTIPASQPIRTRGGYPVNSGTPARLYVGSDYSIQVQDKNGSVAYTSLTSNQSFAGIITIVLDDIAALRAVTWPFGRPSLVTLVNNWTTGDGGGSYRWDSTSTAADTNGTVIKEAATATGRWIRQASFIALTESDPNPINTLRQAWLARLPVVNTIITPVTNSTGLTAAIQLDVSSTEAAVQTDAGRAAWLHELFDWWSACVGEKPRLAFATGSHSFDFYRRFGVETSDLIEITSQVNPATGNRTRLLTISAITYTPIVSNRYTMTVTMAAGNELGAHVTAGFILGISGLSGNNDAHSGNGAHIVRTVSGDRLTWTTVIDAGKAIVSPTSLTTTVVNGLNGSRVVESSACLIFQPVAFDGNAKEAAFEFRGAAGFAPANIAMGVNELVQTNSERDLLFFDGGTLWINDWVQLVGGNGYAIRAVNDFYGHIERSQLGSGEFGQGSLRLQNGGFATPINCSIGGGLNGAIIAGAGSEIAVDRGFTVAGEKAFWAVGPQSLIYAATPVVGGGAVAVIANAINAQVTVEGGSIINSVTGVQPANGGIIDLTPATVTFANNTINEARPANSTGPWGSYFKTAGALMVQRGTPRTILDNGVTAIPVTGTNGSIEIFPGGDCPQGCRATADMVTAINRVRLSPTPTIAAAGAWATIDNTVLTGTTGTPNNITLSLASNTLYIENRSGQTAVIEIMAYGNIAI